MLPKNIQKNILSKNVSLWLSRLIQAAFFNDPFKIRLKYFN